MCQSMKLSLEWVGRHFVQACFPGNIGDCRLKSRLLAGELMDDLRQSIEQDDHCGETIEMNVTVTVTAKT